jgi:subtilisin family serine protease
MRSEARINEVHAGLAPLPQGYDGTGIAVGIIDTGVDLTHPDLKDSSGNTRVMHLWDQRKPVAANTPSYGYGQEWDNTAIDAGLATSDDMQGFGHGTHVTGISAGDGSAINKNKGVAPNAAIIEVAFDFNNTTDPTYIDAVDYIFDKAQQLGMPCVINASLGDYYGSHDGYDLQSQMISNLLNQQAGRAMVAAAGNAGNIPFHLGYNVTSDTSFSWVRHNPAFPNTYLQLWGDTSDFDNIDFSIGADVNTTTASYRGRLAFRDIFYNLGVFKQDTLFSSSGNRLAIIQSFGSIQGPAYQLEFLIIPDSVNYAWRLMTTGSGRFDTWKFYDGSAQPGFTNSGLPSAAVVPDIVYYKLPDLNSTIVSGFQCLDNVITVGNYGNRNSYVDVNLSTYTDPSVTPGALAFNSSSGPTRDGRIKPDITAPGGLMLSCGQLSLMAIWLTQPTNAVKIAEGGFHIRDGGTSSSSPVVAGIAALFLQRYPGATAMQVKNAILQCAIQDSFTGNNLPDNAWGHGKADAFNTLTNCSLTSIQPDPQTISMLLFPNPVMKGDEITLESIQHINQVHVYDMTGRNIYTANLNEQAVSTRLKVDFHAGVYILKTQNKNGETSASFLTVLD